MVIEDEPKVATPTHLRSPSMKTLLPKVPIPENVETPAVTFKPPPVISTPPLITSTPLVAVTIPRDSISTTSLLKVDPATEMLPSK